MHNDRFLRVRVAVLLVIGAIASPSFCVNLPQAPPPSVGMSTERLARMDSVIRESIEKKELPGAVVLVARHGKIVWRKAYGARAVEPQREAMTTDTIFDLASLTKVVATTTSIMILIEQGKVRLADSIVKFIPEMKGGGRDAITIELLLTHMTGFAPDFDLRERWTGYDEAIKRLYREPVRTQPGTRFVYSDINYIALGEVVHRVSGLMLDEFARQNVFVPLGMRETGFRPDGKLRARIAPTEKRRGQMNYLGDSGENAGAEGEQWLRGQVHDPTSFRMGGVAGHAGLFSTVDDLATFCQMLLNGGALNGARILSPMTIAMMTRPHAVAENGSARGLGWDIASSFSANKGDLFPLGSFGHTGFTGTSIWIDPASDTFVIFLSNTNQTGRDAAGRSTIDILFKAPNVKLTALFSPEHGIRGVADEKVSDTKDEQTGLPIYSLYGETRRPKPEQLKDLDALVYDIQDVGARFYTYITTLGYVVEEAAKAKLPIFVLDRPNPINGTDVEGPIADQDKLSFIAYHTIPVRHGLTVGELARLYNEERHIGADLRVIKLENWRRAMWFDATGLTWFNPSPNMRSLTEAALYPGVGLLEATNLSVGRGTDTPFEVIGAPWLDGAKLANHLNGRRIPGVRFIPVRFTPKSSVFKNEECKGVNVVVTDRAKFQSVSTGIEIAAALHQLFPTQWKIDGYSHLLVNSDALERLKRGDSPEEIVRSWRTSLEGFQRARAKLLLYE